MTWTEVPRKGKLHPRIAARLHTYRPRVRKALQILIERGWNLRVMPPDDMARTLVVCGQGVEHRFNRLDEIDVSALPQLWTYA